MFLTIYQYNNPFEFTGFTRFTPLENNICFENKMQPKFKHIQQEIISQLQIQRDQATIELLMLKERFEQQRKLTILNEFVDFNAPIVLPILMPLLINIEEVDFIIRNNKEIIRKFSINELHEFSIMFRSTKMFFNKLESFKDLKQKYNNIKPVKKYPKQHEPTSPTQK